MFVKMIKSRREEWLLISIICLIILVFSVSMEYFMSLETDKYMDISTPIFMGITCAVMLFISFSGIATKLFNLSVGMGVTRKSFVICTCITSVIKYGAVFLLGFANHLIMKAVRPGKEILNMDYIFRPDACILLIVVLSSAEIMMGSLILRFGTKCYWVLWGIYMLMCLIPSNIANAMKKEGDSLMKSLGLWIADVAANITRLHIIGIGAVAAAVFLGISSYILMTQDVTA